MSIQGECNNFYANDLLISQLQKDEVLSCDVHLIAIRFATLYRHDVFFYYHGEILEIVLQVVFYNFMTFFLCPNIRWSLGAIMYEMLVGYPPFYSDDPMSTCRKVTFCKTPNYPYLQEEGQKSNCTGNYYGEMIGRTF